MGIWLVWLQGISNHNTNYSYLFLSISLDHMIKEWNMYYLRTLFLGKFCPSLFRWQIKVYNITANFGTENKGDGRCERESKTNLYL